VDQRGEEALQAVIVFLEDGIELVVVAAGALDGQPQKGGAEHVGDVVEVLLPGHPVV
jgi:hypothetical protein